MILPEISLTALRTYFPHTAWVSPALPAASTQSGCYWAQGIESGKKRLMTVVGEARPVKKMLLLLYTSVKCVGLGSCKNPGCAILSMFSTGARWLEWLTKRYLSHWGFKLAYHLRVPWLSPQSYPLCNQLWVVEVSAQVPSIMRSCLRYSSFYVLPKFLLPA